jgi:hypothetical protein
VRGKPLPLGRGLSPPPRSAPVTQVPQDRTPWNPAAERAPPGSAEGAPEDSPTVNWDQQDLAPPEPETISNAGNYDGIWPPANGPSTAKKDDPEDHDEENPPKVDWEWIKMAEHPTVPLTWPEFDEPPKKPMKMVPDDDGDDEPWVSKKPKTKAKKHQDDGPEYAVYSPPPGYHPHKKQQNQHKKKGSVQDHLDHHAAEYAGHADSMMDNIQHAIKEWTSGGNNAEKGFEDSEDHLEANLREGLGPDGPIFFFGGIFVLSMLVMIPVWDGMSLLRNPVWHWMYGNTIPYCLLAFALVPFVFALTVILILKFTARRLKGDTRPDVLHFKLSIRGHVSGLFVLFVGVMMVMIGRPIQDMAFQAHNAFWDECYMNEKTSPLYDESQELQHLRETPACSHIPSVEHCPGYKETEESNTLKKFEKYFQCSGFCYHPPHQWNNKVVTMSISYSVVSPLMQKLTIQKRGNALQDMIKKLKKQQPKVAKGSDEYVKLSLKIKFLQGQKDHYDQMFKEMSNSNHLDLLQKEADASPSLLQNKEAELQAAQGDAEMDAALQKFVNHLDVMDTSSLDAELSKVIAMKEKGETRSAGAAADLSKAITNITVFDQYPRTLFHDSQYYGSCSSMAGTDMHSYVADIGFQIMCEGVFLIAISVVSAFILIVARMGGSSAGDGTERWKPNSHVHKPMGYGTTEGDLGA